MRPLRYTINVTLDVLFGRVTYEMMEAGWRQPGLSKHIDLKLVSRLEVGSEAVAMRYEPNR